MIETRHIQLFEAFEKVEFGVGELLLESFDLFKLLVHNGKEPLLQPMDTATAREAMTEAYEARDAAGNLKWKDNPKCRVFFTPWTDKIESTATAQLRVYPIQMMPRNNFVGEVYVQADIIVSSKIDKISGGRRKNKIAAEVVGCLNGKAIGLVGDLTLYSRPIVLRQFKGDMWGYSLVFQTGVVGRGR